MRLFAVALAMTLALTACTSASLDGGAGTESSEETAGTTEPEPTATPAQASSEDPCDGSLEGCFSYEEMDEYVSAIIPMMQE